uniref:Serine protease n=1 Tax=Leersia perrieri TaxID=77586 RepID=A0A0D9XYM2_9ORYZ
MDPEVYNDIRKCVVRIAIGTPAGVFNMCNQPVRMSQEVHVYDGLSERLTPGNVTRFNVSEFCHNCVVIGNATFGAPVIDKNGEMVGMNHSHQYPLTAIKISALQGTIRNIKNTLWARG